MQKHISPSKAEVATGLPARMLFVALLSFIAAILFTLYCETPHGNEGIMIAPFVFCTEAFIAFAISALLGVPSTIWLLNQCIYARHEVMLKEWCLMVPGALMSFCFVAMGLNFVGHHALRVLS